MEGRVPPIMTTSGLAAAGPRARPPAAPAPRPAQARFLRARARLVHRRVDPRPPSPAAPFPARYPDRDSARCRGHASRRCIGCVRVGGDRRDSVGQCPDIPVAETPVPEPRIPARPQTTPPAAAAPDPSADLPSPVPGDQTTRSARDALRPGYRDPRLYVAPCEFPRSREDSPRAVHGAPSGALGNIRRVQVIGRPVLRPEPRPQGRLALTIGGLPPPGPPMMAPAAALSSRLAALRHLAGVSVRVEPPARSDGPDRVSPGHIRRNPKRATEIYGL